jgi:nicotinamidase/pyrazinamidase
MLDGPLVFVDVDTQRDFLHPDGALAIAGAEAILGNLARLTGFARERGIPILATACAHTIDEADPEPFPPHCLVGSAGAERVEATAWEGSHVVAPGEPHRLSGDPVPAHVTLQKTRYDVFSAPAAEAVFAHLGRGGATFVVYGVATDYCVKAAVEGLLGRGYPVALVVDAVRAVDPEAEPAILSEFARRGVLLVLTEVVCGGSG